MHLGGVFMTQRAIVMDIDGTLLNSQKQISDLTREALISAQNKGILLILASGRPTAAMTHYAEILEMNQHHGLLVSYNGSRVVDCQTGETLFNQPIRVQDGKAVLEHLKKFDVIVMIENKDYMMVNDVFHNQIVYQGKEINIIEYEARGGQYKLCEKDDLSEFLDYEVNKILIAGDPDYLNENYKEIMKPFDRQLNCMFTAPFYFEFTADGIDKAKALDAVLGPLGVDGDDVIAFGDGHNDMTMLQYCGTGIAMGNAVDDLKAIADEIGLSNDEDGIAHSLATLI